ARRVKRVGAVLVTRAPREPHLFAERGDLREWHHELPPVQDALLHHQGLGLPRLVVEDEPAHRAHSLPAVVDDASAERNEHGRSPPSCAVRSRRMKIAYPPHWREPLRRLQKHGQDAQKGPDARRRPMAAREAYSLYVERAAKGANEADGPFSAS